MGVSQNFIGLIQRTNDSFIRDNIYMIDRTLLAKALKNIDAQYQDKILRNMTDEASEEVKRIMAGLDNVSNEAIEAAQQEILGLASQII